jgi:hypothetical protein
MAHFDRSARTVVGLYTCMVALAGCAPDTADAAALPQWSAVEELRIGGGADPSQALTRVDQIAVDDEGSVYVSQSEEATIKVFDPSGNALRTIGTRGTEAGEFDRLYAVGFVADTLYAIDFGLRRVSYFTPEGELVRTHQVAPPPVDAPLRPAMPFAVFADGSMAIGHAWSSNISMDDLLRVPQLRLAAGSAVSDTVAWLSYERTARRVPHGQQSIVVGSPLSDDSFVIFSPDGARLVSVDRRLPSGSGPSTFGLTVSDGWGDTIYSRRYEYEPVEIEQDVIDQMVAGGAQRVSGAFQSADEAQDFVRGAMFLPEHYPPATTALFAERGGALWLQREAIVGQPQRWMVLDQEGEPIAETAVPESVRVLTIRDDTFWALEFDESGVPSVVRYRIER